VTKRGLSVFRLLLLIAMCVRSTFVPTTTVVFAALLGDRADPQKKDVVVGQAA
jgi:hypothetical protein